ncbi:ribonuclease [Stenotrophomonas maltophilia]
MFAISLILASALASGAASDGGSVRYVDSGKNGFPFSEAVHVGNTVYLSGQLGVDPATGKLVEGGIEAESQQTLRNVQAALQRNGLDLRDAVKCTVFLADMADWPAFNIIYRSYFPADRYPARSAMGVNGLAMNARVEVECIAAR